MVNCEKSTNCEMLTQNLDEAKIVYYKLKTQKRVFHAVPKPYVAILSEHFAILTFFSQNYEISFYNSDFFFLEF